jgi:hypothetical protein
MRPADIPDEDLISRLVANGWERAIAAYEVTNYRQRGLSGMTTTARRGVRKAVQELVAAHDPVRQAFAGRTNIPPVGAEIRYEHFPEDAKLGEVESYTVSGNLPALVVTFAAEGGRLGRRTVLLDFVREVTRCPPVMPVNLDQRVAVMAHLRDHATRNDERAWRLVNCYEGPHKDQLSAADLDALDAALRAVVGRRLPERAEPGLP